MQNVPIKIANVKNHVDKEENGSSKVTALNSTLWFLSDPNYIDRLMTRAAKFAIIIQYHGVKAGKTIAVRK